MKAKKQPGAGRLPGRNAKDQSVAQNHTGHLYPGQRFLPPRFRSNLSVITDPIDINLAKKYVVRRLTEKPFLSWDQAVAEYAENQGDDDN